MTVYEEQSGDNVSENIKLAVLQKYLCDGELARHLNLLSARLTTYDLARKEAINHLRAKQTWTASGGSDPMDLSPLGKGKGKGKGNEPAKECFSCGKPGHNKNECRNLSAALRKKSVQPDKAGRYAGVEGDPETGKRKPSGGKGTGAVSPAPGLDACLLYENDSDQDVCLFPLPMVDESNDDPEDLMALSRRVLFDTGAARSVSCRQIWCALSSRPRIPLRHVIIDVIFIKVNSITLRCTCEGNGRHLARTCFLIVQVLMNRGWLTGPVGDGVNDYGNAQEGKRRYRCGLLRRDVAATRFQRRHLQSWENSVSRQMGVHRDRKVDKEAMVQYGKIHARGDVTCVSFWSTQCELCGCCRSAQRVLCESCPTHQVSGFRSLVVASAHLVHETVCS